MGFFTSLWSFVSEASGYAYDGTVRAYRKTRRRIAPEMRTLRTALVIEVLVFLGCIVPLAFISNMSVKLIVLETGAVVLTITLLWLSLKHLISGVVVGTVLAGTKRTESVDSLGAALSLPLYGIYEYARIVAAILASELAVGLIALWLPLHNNPLVSLLGLVVGVILVAYAIWQQGVLGWPKIVWFTAVATLFIALAAILAPEASKALADRIAQSDALLKLVTGAEMSAGALLFVSIAVLIAVFAMLTLGSGFVRMLGLAVLLLYLPLFAQTVFASWPELNTATDEWRRQKKVATVRKVDSTMPNSELAQRLIAALKVSATTASENAIKEIGKIEKKAQEEKRPLTPAEITQLFEEYKLGAGVQQGVDGHIEQFRKNNPKLFLEEQRKEKLAPKEATKQPKQTSATQPQSQPLDRGCEWTGPGEFVYVAHSRFQWRDQCKINIPPFGYGFRTTFKSAPCELDALLNESIVLQKANEHTKVRHAIGGANVDSIRYRPTSCESVTLKVLVFHVDNPVLSQ